VGVSAIATRSAGGALRSPQLCDQSRPIPVDRWDVERQADFVGGMAVQFGVMLEGVQLFDPAALGISDTEAALMDPQQRLLLETASEALLARPNEAADEALRSNWGVFVVGGSSLVGCTPHSSMTALSLGQLSLCSELFFLFYWLMQGVSSNDYHRLISKHGLVVTAYSATGTALSVVAGRLSFTMRLKGPALSVDTACSSSLVSLHMAFNSLLAAQSSMAVNSGVNLTLTPDTFAMFQAS
jgi:acyl transferase domain-containing protein